MNFTPFNTDNIAEVKRMLDKQTFRTCDYTIGGIYMWANYFHYEYLTENDTLYMRGTDTETGLHAYFLPIGTLPYSKSLPRLQQICIEAGDPHLHLTLIPESELGKMDIDTSKAVPRDTWADYLYESDKLATLEGHKLNKKRNHVNRFTRDHSDFSFENIDQSNILSIRKFLVDTWEKEVIKTGNYFEAEKEGTLLVLDNYDKYPFFGGALKCDNKIIAFTVGEIINDTLYVHIEKALSEYSGSYEMINFLFAKEMQTNHPELKWINREDDGGDDGLREAKMSYNPAMLLKKYDLKI